MESCRHFSDHLPFYLDDELHGDERAALEDHVATCRACRGALSRERRFLDSIRTARPVYQASPHLRERVECIVNGRPTPKLSASKLRRRRFPLSDAAPSYNDSPGARAPRIANRRRRIAFVAA